jgi:hypothetical protein
MADTLVYLYAVGDAVLGETVSPGRTRIGGAAVRVIVDGPLGAVVHGGRRPRPVRCGRRLPGGDGIHVNIPLEEHKLCPLVMIGVRSGGRKELGALADGYRESTEGWADLLRDAARRGMRAPVLAVGDGALGRGRR